MSTTFNRSFLTSKIGSFARDEKILYASCTSGLCNRLEAMLGSYHIALKLGREYAFYWPANYQLCCNYSDLFEPMVPQLSDWDIYNLFETQNQIKVYQAIGDYHSGNYRFTGPIELDDKEQILVVKNFLAPTFKGEENLDFNYLIKELKPKENINKYINEFYLPPNTIGVHIRRSDCTYLFCASANEHFIRTIQEAIDKNPNQKFFLATDDDQTLKEMLNRFGEHILYNKNTMVPRNVFARHTVQGCIESLIDLYLLSKTKCIIGNAYSSYSVYAAKLGSKPLIIASNQSSVLNYIT